MKITAHRNLQKKQHQGHQTAWVCGLMFCLLGLGLLTTQAISEEDNSLAAAAPKSSATFRVRSNLVSVPVSITDAAGCVIQDLKIEDFRIAENGKPVEISRIAEAYQSPLQLALLFDLSGSVHSRFEFEQQAATHFLTKVWKPGDTISIVAFSEQSKVPLRSGKTLPEALQQLGRLEPTQIATAFFDTVVFASRMLYQTATPETRQAQIILSDGADNRSDLTIPDALKEVQHSDTIFYSINPSGASVRLNAINRKGQEDLSALANATGGTAFVSDQSADLDNIFDRIATELRAQYLLSYYSPNNLPDGKFLPIEVTIPQRPDLRIRARQGYYARK
jgi:Ca-activated chloride channel family protein